MEFPSLDYLTFLLNPRKSIPGSEIILGWNAGIYRPKHYEKGKGFVECVCNGLESSADGDIILHLVEDYNSDGTKRYCTVKLYAGYPRGFIFDEILESSTVDMTKVTIYPK